MKPLFALFAFLAAAALAHAEKPTLAITPVTVNPALTESAKGTDNEVVLQRVVQSLQGQLINAFGQTDKFKVVSRTDLPPLIQEQVLGQSGNINPGSAAKQGEIEGASYVLVVGIDDFQLFMERAKFASISRDQQRSILRITSIARIYDSATGTLVASSYNGVTGEDFQQYFTFAARDGDLETAIYSQTAYTLSEEISSSISNQLFPAKVVAKTGKQITINRGSANGFEPYNKTLSIYAVGEAMIDPDTGENLGKEEVYLGSASVIRVDERTTIAMLDEDNGVAYGHIVRIAE